MAIKTRKQHPWYDVTIIMAYNAVFNFIIGARGFGKTYGFAKWAINRNIKTGEQFIYMRRYKDEVRTAKETFFAAVGQEFPDWDFRVQGWTVERASRETRDQKKREWIVMGYFIPLSIAQSMKSVSFHHVTTIIFDEFIIEKGMTHYLPNEAHAFKNFYSTVDRNQDKTKVYFLANSVSISNPHFLEYEIRPDQLPELSTKFNGFMLIQFPDSADFKASVSNTRFGRFISGTDYEEYAVNNQFADAHQEMIGGKPPTAKPRYNLETKHGIFSVWYDHRSSTYYVQERLIGGDSLTMTLVSAKMTNKKVLVHVGHKLLAYLRAAFTRGNVIFDTPKARNAFIEIFSR